MSREAKRLLFGFLGILAGAGALAALFTYLLIGCIASVLITIVRP